MFLALAIISAAVWAGVMFYTGAGAFRVLASTPLYPDPMRMLLFLLATYRVTHAIVSALDPPDPWGNFVDIRTVLMAVSVLLGAFAIYILRSYEQSRR